MLSVEISTESIYCSEYLSRSVTISLSECDAQSVRYTKRLRGNAVLYCSPAQGQWCGWYATSPWWCGVSHVTFWRGSTSRLTFDTRLASGLGRARQKYVFVPYRELAYVTHPHEWRIIVAQWGKDLNRVKNALSFEWEWCIYVQLVWILTTIKRKSVAENGES